MWCKARLDGFRGQDGGGEGGGDMDLEASAEVERKYTVDEGTRLPELQGLPGVQRVDPPAKLELEAFYFDTADLVLARRGITLQRATGSQNAGWRLTVPMGMADGGSCLSPRAASPDPCPRRCCAGFAST